MKPLLTEVLVALYEPQCVNLYHPDNLPKTIKEWIRRVDRMSLDFITDDSKEEIDEEDEHRKDTANKFKGDMLEVFAEIFFGAYQNDPVVGIKDYKPVPLSEDYGVDATGINVVGNPVAIQCKFRSNPSEAIKYRDLTKTFFAGRDLHHLPLNYDDAVIVLTTCNNLNKHVKRTMGSKVRLIGRSMISLRVDNNVSFWSEAEQRIIATIDKIRD